MAAPHTPESSPACASDDCSNTTTSSCTLADCTLVDTPILDPTERLPWSDEDAYYTKLFKAWDNLPVHDASTETELLAELDHIIPHFDAYIGHNDLGFRAWVKRHQLAMELGLAEVPTWPKLYIMKGEKRKWRDEVWVNRYSFLIHQRDIIAKSRLQRMTSCKLDDKKRFFGLAWAHPRQTVRTVQSKSPAKLRNRWYEPLNYCLARMAYESYGSTDFYVLYAEFWGTGATARGAITSDCKIKCEPMVGMEMKSLDCVRGGSEENPLAGA
ncbi:hypothetical protein NLG97_g9201 [Lecanicillium saksenae]|uniref:Uncharacterized protein n=1 Tax=Lecanicillium saksenae TaxID=468837 RepID=A0ACC1QIN7_9HYPO|nr:hypothetical protein NLG97_g9201 [Lecanicillium saksenae]